MKLCDHMAYRSSEEMIFGTAIKPVKTISRLILGNVTVIPEIKVHPRPGSEKNLHTLMREYKRANKDALERCIVVGQCPQSGIQIFDDSSPPQYIDCLIWGYGICGTGEANPVLCMDLRSRFSCLTRRKTR